MKVYITKKDHYKYKYLANWETPCAHLLIGQWFTTLKELKEYTKDWQPEYIKVNF